MTSYDPDPPASTADLPRQARLQALLGRARALASDGSWDTFMKLLQRLPAELEGMAQAEKADRERIGRLEAEVENLRREAELLRALTRPAAIPPRLPPPLLPGEQQVEDIDIEAMNDAFEDVPNEFREITREFEAKMDAKIEAAIRRLEKKK